MTPSPQVHTAAAALRCLAAPGDGGHSARPGLEDRMLFLEHDMSEVAARVQAALLHWQGAQCASPADSLLHELHQVEVDVLELALKMRRMSRELQSRAISA
jgi:hypothetical protein